MHGAGQDFERDRNPGERGHISRDIGEDRKVVLKPTLADVGGGVATAMVGYKIHRSNVPNKKQWNLNNAKKLFNLDGKHSVKPIPHNKIPNSLLPLSSYATNILRTGSCITMAQNDCHHY